MRNVIVVASLLSAAAPSLAAVLTLPVSRKSLSAGRADKFVQSKAETSTSLGTANIAYFATLAVGTPPVDFITLLDTGSSDLVIETAVQADSCTGCTTTGPLYNAANSSTAQVSKTPVVLQYGIGSDSGVAVKDVVSFGGFTMNQTFAACDVNEAFSNIGSTTALLGLGLQPLAQTNATPFVEALANANQLDAAEFGMALAFGNDNYLGDDLQGGGYITLGGTNESLYTGSLAYTNVFDQGTSGYWAVPVTDIALNGVAAGGGTTAALIDSGTNGISLPTSLYQSIYESLGGSYSSQAGTYIYPCSKSASLAFEIGGVWYNMSTKSFQTQSSGGQCTGAVRDGGSGSSSALWILGSTFMENFYVSFKFGSTPQIGMAKINDPSGTLEAASPPPVSGSGSGSSGGSRTVSAGGTQGTSTTGTTQAGAAPRVAFSAMGATTVVVLAGVCAAVLL